jgi:hypothetical protein
MKFLKTKNISKFSVSDNAYIQYPSGRIVIDSTNSVQLPKGTTAQQPQTSLLTNGMVRYNTSSGTGLNPASTSVGLEVYHDGVWRTVRLRGPSTITKQTLGPGDSAETKFGPLTFVPAGADNIIVLVENVIQISTSNFTIVTNPSGYPTGTYLNFLSAVPFGKEVTVYYGFDQ